MCDKPSVLIVATHPVQYQVPWFQYIQKNLTAYNFKVLYISLPDAQQQGSGFDQSFHWDIPLFSDYNWAQVDQKFISVDDGVENFLSLRLKNSNRLLSNHKPDAVILTGWQSFALIQILLSCNKLSIPVLVRGDSNNLKPRKSLVQFMHRHLLKKFDRFLAVGSANHDFYLENGVPESKIYRCPHFVDNQFFINQLTTHRKDRRRIRQQWSIPDGAFCFCYVGKLTAKKNIMDILHAFNHLTIDNVHLLIVGAGEYLQRAQSYVKEQNLRVSFTGFMNQSQITQAYSVSDSLILASNFDETWGLVVNEAMACALPVIVSDQCGCHPDLVEANKTGYSFKFNNIADLTNKMITLAQLPNDQYQRLSRNAQKNILSDYSIESATHGLDKALSSLL